MPYHCILCKGLSKRTQDLCELCYHDLPVLDYACPQCANPLTETHLCGQCLAQEPPFSHTYALFRYQEPISRMILNLKFQEALVNARILGELLTEKIINTWYRDKSLPKIIIPVPLHSVRLQQRGFNQALEIARPIARTLQIPLDVSSCRRSLATDPQATLHPSERKQNIKNAFQLLKPIPYQHIAVIDDVITTGHTINEFCRMLKKSGVRQIDVWCCARAIR